MQKVKCLSREWADMGVLVVEGGGVGGWRVPGTEGKHGKSCSLFRDFDDTIMENYDALFIS